MILYAHKYIHNTLTRSYKMQTQSSHDFTITVINMRKENVNGRKFYFFTIAIKNEKDEKENTQEFHLDREYLSSDAYKKVYRHKTNGKELVVGDLLSTIERELDLSFGNGDFSLIAHHESKEHDMDGDQINPLQYYVNIPIYLKVLPKNPFRFEYDLKVYDPKKIDFVTRDVVDIVKYDEISRDDTMYVVIDIKIVRLDSLAVSRIFGISKEQFPLNYKDFIGRRWLKSKGGRVVECYRIDDIKVMPGRIVS